MDIILLLSQRAYYVAKWVFTIKKQESRRSTVDLILVVATQTIVASELWNLCGFLLWCWCKPWLFASYDDEIDQVTNYQKIYLEDLDHIEIGLCNSLSQHSFGSSLVRRSCFPSFALRAEFQRVTLFQDHHLRCSSQSTSASVCSTTCTATSVTSTRCAPLELGCSTTWSSTSRTKKRPEVKHTQHRAVNFLAERTSTELCGVIFRWSAKLCYLCRFHEDSGEFHDVLLTFQNRWRP